MTSRSRARLRPWFASASLVLSLSAAGCDETDRASLSAQALGLAGSGPGAAGASAAASVAARCALDYAACLSSSPLGVLRCTEAAEACGLFAVDAGTAGAAAPSGTTSPTCALRIADCILRDPFRAELCQQSACEAPPQ